MRVPWLMWYISGVCCLLALLASAVTFHPDVRYLGIVLPIAFGGVALAMASAAVGVGRLPASHRIHQSRPLTGSLFAVAVMASVMLILVG
jgi:hypothetical protein